MTRIFSIVLMIVSLPIVSCELDVVSILNEPVSFQNKGVKVHGYYRQGALYQSVIDAKNFTGKFINVTLNGEPSTQFYKDCEERVVVLSGTFTSPKYPDSILWKVTEFRSEAGVDCLSLVTN
ncbi:hypothetical protein JL49_25125 [Pseudoalteromonas luteoviolacea]|nr:hypothetical protein JL49_25125 [Pseudoalteromonas luteoviolacea]